MRVDMSRPQNLAEVARIARENSSDFAMALDEFVDEFYLDHPDKAAQQRRLDPIPEPVGDALTDAWIGAQASTCHRVGGCGFPHGATARSTTPSKIQLSFRRRALCGGCSLSRAHRLFEQGFCSQGWSRWREPDSLRECRGQRCRSNGRLLRK